jgi:hypothetical protein
MTGRRFALALTGAAAAAGLLGCAGREPTSPALTQAQSITAARMQRRVADIADDSMLGRATPSPALDRMAAYAVAQFQAFGLGPGPGTGFIQTWSAAGGPAPNVVGVLEGSAASLAGEYVVFVAHMDHIGTPGSAEGCAAVGSDSICNGADDNGSGTAAVIELARAFAGLSPRPRRSLLFLLVSGEEEGLLGSRYYVAHPAVPIARTVAAVALDMISRNPPDSVLALRLAAGSMDTIATVVAAAHPELGLRLHVATGGGSDHASFAQAGVPSLALFAGLHADYHRPSDAPDRIDADKAARIARLAFYLGLELANQAAP